MVFIERSHISHDALGAGLVDGQLLIEKEFKNFLGEEFFEQLCVYIGALNE